MRVDLRCTRGNTVALNHIGGTRAKCYRFDSGEECPCAAEVDRIELEIKGEQCIFARESPPSVPGGPSKTRWRQAEPPTGQTERILERDTGVFVEGDRYVSPNLYGHPDAAKSQFVFVQRGQPTSAFSQEMGGDIWIADIVGIEVEIGFMDYQRFVHRRFKLRDPRLLVDLKNGSNRN